MKLQDKNYPYFIIIAIITTVFFLVFGNYFPMPFVDIGREILVPQMMNDGSLIYRDILNIYGAIPYYALSIFYKIFGTSVPVFLLFNAINSFFLLCGLFLLSNEFLTKKQSFIVILCVAFMDMSTAALFSFVRPYSICYTVAFCAFIYSVFLMIKFFKKDNDLFLYFSLILAGFVFATKNDLCLLILVYGLVLLIYKKFTLKRLLLGTISFLFFPIIQYQILIINGLNIEDLLSALVIIIKSAVTPAMTRFHQSIGMLPSNDFSVLKILSTVYLIIFVLLAKFLILNANKKKTIIGYVVFSVLVILFTIISSLRRIFWPMPIFSTLLIIYDYKKLYKNPPLLILGLGAIIASLKTYYSSTLASYGGFTIILLGVFLLAYLAWKNKESLKRIIVMVLILFSINFIIDVWCFMSIDLKKYKFNNYEIKLLPNDYTIFESITSWINKNTNETDKILIYPEGEFINVATNRKTHPMIYNLHDINIETFGFDYIQEQMNTMDYIVDISDLKFCGEALSKHTYNTLLLHALTQKDFTTHIVIPYHTTTGGKGNIKIYKHR